MDKVKQAKKDENNLKLVHHHQLQSQGLLWLRKEGRGEQLLQKEVWRNILIYNTTGDKQKHDISAPYCARTIFYQSFVSSTPDGQNEIWQVLFCK